jgi:hypothetical protein
MDRYDEAIAHFNKYPEELASAEEFPGDHRIGGCLFVNASQILFSYRKQPNGKFLSGPCRIKTWPEQMTAQDDWVTTKILADPRVPVISDLRLEHLPVLADYQRKWDKLYNRHFPTYRTVENSSDDQTGDTQEDAAGSEPDESDELESEQPAVPMEDGVVAQEELVESYDTEQLYNEHGNNADRPDEG